MARCRFQPPAKGHGFIPAATGLPPHPYVPLPWGEGVPTVSGRVRGHVAAAPRRSGHVHRAAGGCTVFYVCAHQQGGLDCSRVPHRCAGVLVACSAPTRRGGFLTERTADLPACGRQANQVRATCSRTARRKQSFRTPERQGGSRASALQNGKAEAELPHSKAAALQSG